MPVLPEGPVVSLLLQHWWFPVEMGAVLVAYIAYLIVRHRRGSG